MMDTLSARVRQWQAQVLTGRLGSAPNCLLHTAARALVHTVIALAADLCTGPGIHVAPDPIRFVPLESMTF